MDVPGILSANGAVKKAAGIYTISLRVKVRIQLLEKYVTGNKVNPLLAGAKKGTAGLSLAQTMQHAKAILTICHVIGKMNARAGANASV